MPFCRVGAGQSLITTVCDGADIIQVLYLGITVVLFKISIYDLESFHKFPFLFLYCFVFIAIVVCLFTSHSNHALSRTCVIVASHRDEKVKAAHSISARYSAQLLQIGFGSNSSRQRDFSQLLFLAVQCLLSLGAVSLKAFALLRTNFPHHPAAIVVEALISTTFFA